jgi:hypothetical protein
MNDQAPMDPRRAALESLYYDQATDLCDLVLLAETGDDRMHGVHLAVLEALADAHEEGRREAREELAEEMEAIATTERACSEAPGPAERQAHYRGAAEALAAAAADLRPKVTPPPR